MNTRPSILATVAALAVAALTAAGATASIAADPLTTILQKADLPAKADYTSAALPPSTIKGLAAIGIQAKGATFHASVKISGTKAHSFDGVLFLTGSAAQAAKLYALSVREAKKRPNKTTMLRLPRFGDAQFARYFVGASSAELLVRKRTAVWILQVQGSGLLVRSQAALTGDLKTYGSKQARRVGSG
jgi:hypothetical protein